jgi:hypothetical protein
MSKYRHREEDKTGKDVNERLETCWMEVSKRRVFRKESIVA